MIQGCFSNPGSPVSSSSSGTSSSSSKENLVTCIYQTRLFDSPIHLTLTWSKTPHTHSLTIHAPDWLTLTVPLYPSTFSLFRARPGSKSVQLSQDKSSSKDKNKIKLYWDFTRAEFTRPNSAEPESRFYLAITYNRHVQFFLGDLWDEFSRRVGPPSHSAVASQLSRREHIFGRRNFTTKTEFLGCTRHIEIECSSGALKVKIDSEVKLTIKRLAWKFRGNERIMIDGVSVEFYWDVFNWVSNAGNPPIAQKSNGGNGVFVFQVGEGGVWPEMVGPEKRLMSKSSPAPGFAAAGAALSPAGSCSSVLQWAEETSDCGRSSSGSSWTTASSGGGPGFSLVIYAWRRP